jgi:hypothetical protein
MKIAKSQHYQNGSGFLESFGFKPKTAKEIIKFDQTPQQPTNPYIFKQPDATAKEILEYLLNKNLIIFNGNNSTNVQKCLDYILHHRPTDIEKMNAAIFEDVPTPQQRQEELAGIFVAHKRRYRKIGIAKDDIANELEWVKELYLETLLTRLIQAHNPLASAITIPIVAVINVSYKHDNIIKKSQLLFPFKWTLNIFKKTDTLVTDISYGINKEEIEYKNIHNSHCTWNETVISFMADEIRKGYEKYLPKNPLIMENQITFVLSVPESNVKGIEIRKFSTEEIAKFYENIKKMVGKQMFNTEINDTLKKTIEKSTTTPDGVIVTSFYNLSRALNQHNQPVQFIQGGKNKAVSKYDKMTVKELHECCTKYKLYHPKTMRKAELIDLLQNKPKSQAKVKK